MEKYDLHIHSNMSDGTYDPAELPALAKEKGVRFMALTDHDTAIGCKAAIRAGQDIGIDVIAGMELDIEHKTELHILGLGIDSDDPAVCRYEEWRGAGRIDRNQKILKKLRAINMDIEPYMPHSKGNDTRLHIAMGIVAAGYAASNSEAFSRYLNEGSPAYVPGERIGEKDGIELIINAGGRAVLAHPCKLKEDPHPLIHRLRDYGLWGIESFYPTSTYGQRELFASIAAQLGLMNMAGGDFHGKNRDAVIGSAWCDDKRLMPAFEALFCGR